MSINEEEVYARQSRIFNSLRTNLDEFNLSDNKGSFIIDIYLREFSNQELEFESLCALKFVLEGLFDNVEIDLEELIDLIDYSLNDNEIESYNTSFYETVDLYNENSGYIYIMMNPSMSGVTKIGLTKNSPEERLKELSKATGASTQFILVYKEYFNDCVSAKEEIHSILSERGERVSNDDELFNTETSEAIKIVQQVKLSDESIQESYESYESYDDTEFQSFEEIPVSEKYLEKGLDYLNGYGECLQDFSKAREYLGKAGELGEAKAYWELGNLYFYGLFDEFMSLDIEKSAYFYEKGRLLNGKYANYCNASLALCYAHVYHYNMGTLGYNQNESNAEKCWGWFFENLDFDDCDGLEFSFVRECLTHFFNNHKVSSVYKEILETKFLKVLRKYRYVLYNEVNRYSLNKDGRRFLLDKFERHQLNRIVEIKWLHEKKTEDRGATFEVLIEKGFLTNKDYIQFDGYSNTSRTIQKLKKNGQEVSTIETGERGTIYVSNIWNHSPPSKMNNLSITVLGSDILEERRKTLNDDQGFIGRLKEWFR